MKANRHGVKIGDIFAYFSGREHFFQVVGISETGTVKVREINPQIKDIEEYWLDELTFEITGYTVANDGEFIVPKAMSRFIKDQEAGDERTIHVSKTDGAYIYLDEDYKRYKAFLIPDGYRVEKPHKDAQQVWQECAESIYG